MALLGGCRIATVVVVFFFFFFLVLGGATRRSGCGLKERTREGLPFPVVDDQFLSSAVVSPTGTEYGISQA